MIGLNIFSPLSGTVLLLFLLGFWKHNIREQQAGRYVSISKMDIFPYKEPELMIRACFFLGLRFLFAYVSISSAYAVNASYVKSSIKSSPIIQGTERKERQQTNPIHRDLRISKETMYMIYMFTLYYALAFHSTCSSRFKSYKSLSNSRTGNPKILGNQQLLFSLLFQLRGFKDLAPSFRGSTMMSKKIRDSWLSQGWRYIIQGTGNQWVQHCQESWLALVPGLWDFSGGLLWA